MEGKLRENGAVCFIPQSILLVNHVLPIPIDPTLTLSNMTSALNDLPDTLWYDFGGYVNVPPSKQNEIRDQFHSDGERKKEVFRTYLDEHPQPTWEHVSDALYQLSCCNELCQSALDRLQSMFPTGECLFLPLTTSPNCFPIPSSIFTSPTLTV